MGRGGIEPPTFGLEWLICRAFAAPRAFECDSVQLAQVRIAGFGTWFGTRSPPRGAGARRGYRGVGSGGRSVALRARGR